MYCRPGLGTLYQVGIPIISPVQELALSPVSCRRPHPYSWCAHLAFCMPGLLGGGDEDMKQFYVGAAVTDSSVFSVRREAALLGQRPSRHHNAFSFGARRGPTALLAAIALILV